ncbi:MAG: Ig-like domain-containing protein [Marinilabiliales bacterium]|nr:Ig-like domain-containing protein [Marinilabiliales bacterium]
MKTTLILLRRILVSAGMLALPLIILYSCANMGMPKGGPKDKTPPVILKSNPVFNQRNFKDNKVRITFDEFVNTDDLNDKFIVSPPTSKKPLFRTKGKTLIVDLNDKLKPNTTYSLDFKDGVSDNNEKNKYKNLRLAFSTGPELDTLRLVGFVRNAFNLEPAINCYILLYQGTSDTLVHKTKPDYVGKTNSQGFFAITNLPATSYQVYALGDVDNNLKYTEGVDSISFLADRITPSAKFLPDRDTLATGPDTLVVLGKTRFYPDPLNLSLFFEKGFELNLDKYDWPDRKTINLTFVGSTADTFHVEPLNVHPKGEWMMLEKSRHADTLKLWLTDSLVYKRDTLALRLSYLQQDSLGAFFVKKDTLKFFMKEDPVAKTERAKRKERRKIETEPRNIILSTSIGSILDPYKEIVIESPQPFRSFDTSKVKLFVKEDTTYHRIFAKIRPDSIQMRRYRIRYPWAFDAKYKLVVDSTAVSTIYGLYNKAISTEFKTQEEEHYGKIVYNVTNVKCPMIIQLIDNSPEELVERSLRISKDGEISFPYLEPKKYLLKAIFDRNNNGKWDSGNLKTKTEPEEVCYYLNVIKVRANWDNSDTWMLPDPANFTKKIYDAEAEAEKLQKKKKNAPQKTKLF